MAKPSLTSLFSSLLIFGFLVGTAMAQDTGVGIDFGFGNKLETQIDSNLDCDPRGMSWLRAGTRRSPTGAQYICAPEILQEAQGEWLRRGRLSVGWVGTSGDDDAPNWLRFTDWDQGFVLGLFELEYLRPSDGSYVELRGSRVSTNNQYLKVRAGRAGKYRVDAYARTQPNVMSTTAHSIWNGVGTDRLVLKDGLVPAASSVAEVAAVSAAAEPMRLQVKRDKQGLAVNYFLNPRWTGYVGATNEQRRGARAFGGAFFFNYPFPDNGGVYETPRPIRDSTVNLNAGVRFAGNLWRMDLAYTGSFYRNSHSSFSYEAPLPLWTVVPGALAVSPLFGEFAGEPNNDYHNLQVNLTRKLAMNGELSFGASGGVMRQNERLRPPMDCVGTIGIDFSPLGAPVSPFLEDCDDWNTTAALSRQRADMKIDLTTADLGLILQPDDDLTYRGNLSFKREDYRNVYVAFNPLNGKYGYIAANGTMGAVVPEELGIWDLGANVNVPTRIMSLPLDKETRELMLGADLRLGPASTVGLTYTHTDVARTNRERRKVKDDVLKLSWANRSMSNMSFRASYQFLQRRGSDYDYDPFEFTFAMSLPGFGLGYDGLSPHTVEAMRKYDVGKRDEHKVAFITTFIPSETMTLNAALRGDWNDYKAEIGRQSLDTWGLSLSWDWQPNLQTHASAYFGWDESRLGTANVNDGETAPADPSLGGPVYPTANRWWLNDKNRNRSAGISISHDFGRTTLDAGWNITDTRGTTSFRYNSIGALTLPDLAGPELAGGFPNLTYRVNTLNLGLHIPIRDRWSVRVFDIWEKGRISDWHYSGLENGLVVDHRVYLDDGWHGYKANVIGVLLEVQL